MQSNPDPAAPTATTPASHPGASASAASDPDNRSDMRTRLLASLVAMRGLMLDAGHAEGPIHFHPPEGDTASESVRAEQARTVDAFNAFVAEENRDKSEPPMATKDMPAPAAGGAADFWATVITDVDGPLAGARRDERVRMLLLLQHMHGGTVFEHHPTPLTPTRSQSLAEHKARAEERKMMMEVYESLAQFKAGRVERAERGGDETEEALEIAHVQYAYRALMAERMEKAAVEADDTAKVQKSETKDEDGTDKTKKKNKTKKKKAVPPGTATQASVPTCTATPPAAPTADPTAEPTPAAQDLPDFIVLQNKERQALADTYHGLVAAQPVKDAQDMTPKEAALAQLQMNVEVWMRTRPLGGR